MIGLPCEWKELTPKEQKKAKKSGYKPGGIVWKSSDSKGKFRFPKNVMIKAVELDGKVRLVIGTKGLFTLVPSKKVSVEPQMKITHVMMDGVTQKITFRCLCKFSELSGGDRALALGTGYKKGDEILYYYDTRTNRFKIQPPPKK
jgi:DNA-binding cell septation regulator SpoVG